MAVPTTRQAAVIVSCALLLSACDLFGSGTDSGNPVGPSGSASCALSFGTSGCSQDLGIQLEIDAKDYSESIMRTSSPARYFDLYIADMSVSGWNSDPYRCQVPTEVCFGACSAGISGAGAHLARLPMVSNAKLIIVPAGQRPSRYCGWDVNLTSCLTIVQFTSACGY